MAWAINMSMEMKNEKAEELVLKWWLQKVCGGLKNSYKNYRSTIMVKGKHMFT